jgi:hypothetical protein
MKLVLSLSLNVTIVPRSGVRSVAAGMLTLINTYFIWIIIECPSRGMNWS